MLTNYAKDINHWEEWQKAYKYGVILIIPPDPPFAQMEALRKEYDPRGQEICGTHISVTVPIPRPLSETNWYELKSIASGIKPFTVYYGPLINYLPAPGVCLAIEPKDALDSLRAALENAAVFKGAPPRKYPFSPHMTIAEFITEEETTTLMTELKDIAPTGFFLCTYLSYMVPDYNFHFTERGSFDLY